jgi:deazaflavin-dependent oxidoreductase (nitroreductase family)
MGFVKRWMYRGGRPDGLTKLINRGWAFVHGLGWAPSSWVTLEVVGRRSGKPVSFPVALTAVHGERYLVSMLGAKANWVLNVRAAGGKATLRHGKVQQVLLEEVEAGRRAPILKAYLRIAPGARPHMPVDKDAPLPEFEKIAADYPVFRLTVSQ